MDKLMAILSDGKWHSTKELTRRLGAGFGRVKYALVQSGVCVDRRAQKAHGWQYRVDLDNPTGDA